MCSLVLLYAICRVVPRCAALLCCCVTNAYIVCQTSASSVCIYVCSVCMFCLLACMGIISPRCSARTRCCKYVASSAELHSAIIMYTTLVLFSPFVAFAIPLHSLLWILLLNKKIFNPGGELPLLLEKVSWCARFSFPNGDCFGCSRLAADG